MSKIEKSEKQVIFKGENKESNEILKSKEGKKNNVLRVCII